MKSGPRRMCVDPDLPASTRRACRRRDDCGRVWRLHLKCNPALAFVVGLATSLAVPDQALAQDPTVLPAATPNVYPISSRPHHWWSCLTANDGIPRTYSYYYSFRVNQPRHFAVVGPDGKTYWRTTVRGLPMGSQWLAP